MFRNFSFQRELMGTVVTVNVVTEIRQIANEAAEKVFKEFQRIVDTYSRFLETSELTKLNQQSGHWVNLSAEFTMLIGYMLDLAKQTDGAFDPTVIDILEAYGYSAKYDYEDKLKDPELEKRIDDLMTNRPGWKAIELDKENQKVKLAKGQRIEFGGVGKGYAIDRGCEILGAIHKNFLIDAGGDIRCLGVNANQRPWQIGLKHQIINPEDQKEVSGLLGKVVLTAGSFCSSGIWAKKVGKFHHIINPQSGRPTAGIETSYTYAATALQADSWCTPLLILGEDGLKKLPEGVSGMIVTSDQQIHQSEKFPVIHEI